MRSVCKGITSPSSKVRICRRRAMTSSSGITVMTVFLCLCYLVAPSLGAVNAAMVQGVEDATEQLRKVFDGIRSEVLGADALEAEYERVGFDYTPLNITNILSNEYAAGLINEVLDVMLTIGPSSSSNSDIPQDCCEGSSRSAVCCHGCPSEDGLLSAISDSFLSKSQLEGIRAELEFGHVNGSLLQFPTPQPAADCAVQDSNLQPWYMNVVRNRPLEIVLLIDLNDFVLDDANTLGLREAAIAVLNSLTLQDKVHVVLVGERVVQYEFGGAKVLPVCASSRKRLESFIRDTSPSVNSMGSAAYLDAFTAAFNAFSSSTNTDRLILFFTTLSNLYTPSNNPMFFRQMVVQNVTQLNSAKMNSVVVSAYYNDAEGGRLLGNLERLMPLVDQNSGVLRELVNVTNVRDYYEVFNPVASTDDVVVGREVNSRGDASLSLTKTLMDGEELIGLFHALLPWNMLFPLVDDSLLSGRGNSHFFVMDSEGNILYHPLVPGDFQSPVSVAALESQSVLDRLQSSSTSAQFEQSATKSSLAAISVRSPDGNSFISRSVDVHYTCRRLGTEPAVVLYACVGVAWEDEVTARLKDADLDDLYSDDKDRFPIYHTTVIPEKHQCNYFCSTSTDDQLSVQLTSPSKPPADVELEAINNFLRGDPASLSWAEEGVANELSVVSVVRDTWINGADSSSNAVMDYVVRRHLATPSGLYLTFPFIRLSPDYVAPLSEWFVLSSAHPNTLTLSPPRRDPLWEGDYVVSAGVTVSTPPQDQDSSEGGLLAVVAADLPLPSLRVLLEEAMPLCTQDGYNCFLLDDQGNMVYHDILLTSSFQDNLDEPLFLAEFTPQIEVFREILISILNDSVALKLRCIDYLNQTVRQRLFFSLDPNNNEVHAVSSNGIEYAIQNIPGTNIFLGVVHRTPANMIDRPCFCTKTCQTCKRNEQNGCECPCQCPEDCTTPHNFPACPVASFEGDQLAPDVSVPAMADVTPLCSSVNCACKTKANDCGASRDCYWCSEQMECRHVTQCCNKSEDTAACCTQTPFSCLSSVCMKGVELPSKCGGNGNDDGGGEVSDSSGSGTTASIVGGVLGALLVLVLIAVLAAFFVWQRFFRKGLYEDDQKDNAFDFSKTRINAKNPIDGETKDVGTNSEEKNNSTQNLAAKPATGDETTL